MKNFLLILILFINYNFYSQQLQKETQKDSVLVCIDTINGIPIYKKFAKNELKKGQTFKKIDIKIVSKAVQPEDTLDLSSIEHKILQDLPEAKAMDSLWYYNLYQPVLFDSIQSVKNQVSIDSFHSIDSITLKKQLALLNQKTQLEIVYHPALARTIIVFLKNRKKSLKRLFSIANYYFPIFEEKLSKYDIPLEMKYLAIVESALNPRAVSPAGAGGLWQFMYSTGKMYDLEINNYVDERFDPLKSTEAACQHMQDLYKIFKDWNLVLAAYNSGAGNVTKAIRRSGGYTNYWNIRPFLPRETAGYVPLFQATLFLGEYAKEYGLQPNKNLNLKYILTDTIQVKHTLTFKQVSKLLKIKEDELEFLNPQYKLNIIPYVQGKHYAIKLPVNLAGVFVNNENLIYAYAQKKLEKREKPLPKFYKFNNYIVYHVRQGDYLGKIARKFHVGISKIKHWNHLHSSRLHIGQKLRIYSRHAVAQTFKKTKKLKTKHQPKTQKVITYRVKAGDTLWNISRKYQITVTQIRKWNNLRAHDKLKPGMKLKIIKS